ncbi:MAG: hypothetical protein KBI15_02690, partial [Candidatus Pacebacteria bacterium]|nr:hypothetical protein [Candidatus Paceibacterota bacterium]
MNKKFIAILVSILAICGMVMIAGSALATVTSVSITSPATTTFYKPQPGSEAAGYLSITVTADTEGQADLYYRIGPESSPVYETPLGAQASLVNGTKPIEQLPFLIPATTTDGLYDVFVKLHQPYGGGGGVWVSATGTNLIGVDGTAPTMSAISFAGKAGTVSGGIWTVDISDITSEALLDTGSMTVSEASTLQSKTVDGVDVSGWGF